MNSFGKGLSSLIPPSPSLGTAENKVSPQQISPQPTQNKNSPRVIQGVSEAADLPVKTSAQKTIKENKTRNNVPEKTEAVFHIEVLKIKPNPYQPRRIHKEEDLNDLARSIREVGILQPLVVSKVEKEIDHGTAIEYQLISGERRLRAAKKAGLERVPAIIRRVDINRDKLSLALIENIQRSDLNPIETARGYARLQDEFGLTQREIAGKVGKSRSSVSNTLRLLNLPSHIQNAVEEGKISESQARSLLSIQDPQDQEKEFLNYLNNFHGPKKNRSRTNKFRGSSTNNREKNFWEQQLEERLAIPVKILRKNNKGRIVLNFHNQEEWQKIIDNLLRD